MNLTPATRREAWLADRRTCITGTDVAAILGVSRFSSPIKVYLDKKGLSETTGENEAMIWGRRLEIPILEAYAEQEGVELQFADSYALLRVPGFPILGATLDAVRTIDNAPVDAKNTRNRGDEWGPAGSDQIPVYYAAQLAVQMMVQNSDFADLAVLFHGSEFVPYRIHRDRDTEEMIKERVSIWWHRHIDKDCPPDVDGSDSSSEYLKKRFARSTEITREATPEVLQWIKTRRETGAMIDELETQKKEAENLIKAYLGDAQAIPGLVTWKNNKDGSKIDYQKAFEHLVSEQDRERLLAPFVVSYPGARVLRISTPKEK